MTITQEGEVEGKASRGLPEDQAQAMGTHIPLLVRAPWRAELGHSDWIIWDADGVPFARIEAWVGRDQAASEARARVIAAAPALLEALEPEALDFVADCLERLEAAPRMIERLRIVAADQRVAIAKAGLALAENLGDAE